MPLAADELTALADAALDAAASCQAAELRVERIRSQTVRLHDARPETTADNTNFGMGVRVVADGAVGFAATVDVRPQEAANLVRRALEMAKVTSRAAGGRVELAPEPSHGDVTWSSAFEIDPSTVPLSDKVALLAEWSGRLGDHDAVSHTSASLLAVSEQSYLADLNGTRATQHRVRLQADPVLGGPRPVEVGQVALLRHGEQRRRGVGDGVVVTEAPAPLGQQRHLVGQRHGGRVDLECTRPRDVAV